MQKGQEGALQMVWLRGREAMAVAVGRGEVREGHTDQGVETQTGLGRGSVREPSPTQK